MNTYWLSVFLFVGVVVAVTGSSVASAGSHGYPNSIYAHDAPWVGRPSSTNCTSPYHCKDPYKKKRRFNDFMIIIGLNGQLCLFWFGSTPFPWLDSIMAGGMFFPYSSFMSPYYSGLFGRNYGLGQIAY